MGPPRSLWHLNWPSLVCGVFHVFSSTLVVVLSKLAMSSLDFQYPATLAFIHSASVAVCLWFWTIFGLFKPRHLPLHHVMKTAVGAAICSLLSMLSLMHNPLSLYQAARIATAPTAMMLEWMMRCSVLQKSSRGMKRNTQRASNLNFLLVSSSLFIATGSFLMVFSDEEVTPFGVMIAVMTTALTAMYHLWSLPLRQATNAHELQLQLYTKTMGAMFLAPVVPLVDNYIPHDVHSIFHYDFADSSGVLILITGLLSFLAFVAMRASVSRASPSTYNSMMCFISALIFAADTELRMHASRQRLVHIALIMVGSVGFVKYKQDYARSARTLSTARCADLNDRELRRPDYYLSDAEEGRDGQSMV